MISSSMNFSILTKVMASSRDRAWNVLLALGNIAFAYTFADVLIEIQLVGIRTIAKDAELLHQEGAREIYYACSTHTIFSPPAIEGLSSGLFQEVIITNTIPVFEQKSLPQFTFLSWQNFWVKRYGVFMMIALYPRNCSVILLDSLKELTAFSTNYLLI